MEPKTWTADQIEALVLSYSEGCTKGKLEFLSEAFGIEATCEHDVVITLRINVSKWDDDGTEVDKYNVTKAAVTVLDRYLSDELMVFRVEAFSE